MLRPLLLLPALAALLLVLPLGPAPHAEPRPKDVALARTLRAQRLSKVEFKDLGLGDALKWLRVATGRNFFVKQAALAKAGIEYNDIRYTMSFEDVSLASLLDMLLEPYGMAWVVRDNVVWITSKADSYGKPVTRMYAISHITWQKVDFIAPEINLNPSGFIEEEYVPEVEVEDDPLATGDAVAELLRELVLPEQWAQNDDWAIRATDTYLVVRAPPAVHAQVPGALARIASMK